jgi:hypothetical protein
MLQFGNVQLSPQQAAAFQADVQLMPEGSAKPWYKTWWGIGLFGLVGFGAYKLYTSRKKGL